LKAVYARATRGDIHGNDTFVALDSVHPDKHENTRKQGSFFNVIAKTSFLLFISVLYTEISHPLLTIMPYKI